MEISQPVVRLIIRQLFFCDGINQVIFFNNICVSLLVSFKVNCSYLCRSWYYLQKGKNFLVMLDRGDFAVKSPHSFYIAAWACKMRKAYLESVNINSKSLPQLQSCSQGSELSLLNQGVRRQYLGVNDLTEVCYCIFGFLNFFLYKTAISLLYFNWIVQWLVFQIISAGININMFYYLSTGM